MKNKLVGILIGIMLLITMLPITALATTIASEPQTTAGGLLGRRPSMELFCSNEHPTMEKYFISSPYDSTIQRFVFPGNAHPGSSEWNP